MSFKIHYVTEEKIKLITSLYSDYDIFILKDNFMTSPFKIQREVLQEDSLQPDSQYFN